MMIWSRSIAEDREKWMSSQYFGGSRNSIYRYVSVKWKKNSGMIFGCLTLITSGWCYHLLRQEELRKERFWGQGSRVLYLLHFRMLVGHSGRDTKQIVEYVSLRLRGDVWAGDRHLILRQSFIQQILIYSHWVGIGAASWMRWLMFWRNSELSLGSGRVNCRQSWWPVAIIT